MQRNFIVFKSKLRASRKLQRQKIPIYTLTLAYAHHYPAPNLVHLLQLKYSNGTLSFTKVHTPLRSH